MHTERGATSRLMRTVACATVLAVPLSANALSLWDAYRQALQNDPGYQRQVNLVEATRQQVPQARAELLPRIDAVAAHSRGHLEIEAEPDPAAASDERARNRSRDITLPPTTFEPSPVPREDKFHNSRGTLKLSQTVFDRSRWLELKGARSRTDEARLQLGDTRHALILETARAYYDFLGAQDALEAARLERQAVARQLRLTERRYEEDLGTLTDVHESRARMELAKIDIIDAENDMALARHRLAKLTGSPVSHVDPLPESFDPPPLKPAGMSDWIDQALTSSIAVQIARQQAATAELDLKTQRSGRWPTLSLVGESGYESESLSAVSTGQDRFRNEISLQLRVPLFTGFAVSARIREARFRKFAAEQALRNAKAEISRDVRSAYDSVETSRRRVNTFRKAYDQSLAALELRRKGYLEGLSSNLDLLDAFRDAYRAKRQWLQSRYRYFVDYLTLQSLSGTINDEVIKWMDSFLSGSSDET